MNAPTDFRSKLGLVSLLRLFAGPVAARSSACIVRFLFSTALSLLMVGCASKCDIIDVREYPSPDGKRVATLYGYICYDTTGHYKYVHLHPAGTKMRHPGNVTAVSPGDTVAVAWTTPAELVVSYSYEVPRRGPETTNIDGVTIRFRDAPELRGTQR